jgi:hypothetical protein
MVVALAMAVGAATARGDGADGPSVYETPGMLVF